MYIPPAFAGPPQSELFDFVAAHSFGLLVSTGDNEPVASHLPLLIDRDFAPHGRLLGHVARANPQWRTMHGKPVLAVFSGPHAYISPRWYEAEHVVPTWNYVAVHATGVCHTVADASRSAEILQRTVAYYEATKPEPWSIDASTKFFQQLNQQIVAFEIPIDRLEGKWKLGQNQAVERRERVARQLVQSANQDERAIGELMRAALAERDRPV